MNLQHYIDQGGPIVIVLIVMLALGLIIMLWKFLIILSFKFKKQQKCSECIKVLPEFSDISIVELIVHDKMHSIEKGLESVKIIATISPLLGLLGTVIGIYTAFVSISVNGLENPAFFADGISMAMITTIAGLIVAIPHYIGYNYLVNMMDKLELAFTQELYLHVKSKDA
jgi:biopolymer transport protein ExbB